MKKICFLLIFVMLLTFSGCSLNSLSPEKITTDAVSMYYSNRSYSVVIEDKEIVKELTAIYNTLKLENVSGELDLSSTINIVYYESKKEKAILSIDKNGLLYLYRDIDNIYRVVSKDFQYERLEEIYTIYEDKK
ncbi:MAG TPA: hypothetical protein DC000_03210 [Clostridiales bacterium]|nr:hypothetical protein [Clostridiales bacterium]